MAGTAFQPINRLFKCQGPGCNLENNPLKFVNSGVYFLAIQHQESFHGGMAAALIAIHKGMVLGVVSSKSTKRIQFREKLC